MIDISYEEAEIMTLKDAYALNEAGLAVSVKYGRVFLAEDKDAES